LAAAESAAPPQNQAAVESEETAPPSETTAPEEESGESEGTETGTPSEGSQTGESSGTGEEAGGSGTETDTGTDTEEEEAPPDRPPKTKDDLNDRQKIHKPGTNEYKTRSASPKGPPTAWADPAKADDLTVDAYDNGQITDRFPDGSPKEVKWDTGEPIGE